MSEVSNALDRLVLIDRIKKAAPNARGLESKSLEFLQGYAKVNGVSVPNGVDDYTQDELFEIRQGNREVYDHLLAERFGSTKRSNASTGGR